MSRIVFFIKTTTIIIIIIIIKSKLSSAAVVIGGLKINAISYKIASAPSEDSDQLTYPHCKKNPVDFTVHI